MTFDSVVNDLSSDCFKVRMAKMAAQVDKTFVTDKNDEFLEGQTYGHGITLYKNGQAFRSEPTANTAMIKEFCVR